jgi:hypothetical protein
VSSSILTDHVMLLQQSRAIPCTVQNPGCPVVVFVALQPVADKAQLSSAIITDTLAALPVSPQAVSHVQGPILEVHQVGMPSRVIQHSST